MQPFFALIDIGGRRRQHFGNKAGRDFVDRMLVAVVADQHHIRVVVAPVCRDAELHIGHEGAAGVTTGRQPQVKSNIERNPVMALAGAGHREDFAGDVFVFVFGAAFPFEIVGFADVQFFGGGTHRWVLMSM
jgi:hypothetical protein